MTVIRMVVWTCCFANIAFSLLEVPRLRALPGSLQRVAAARRQLTVAPVALAFWPLTVVEDVLLLALHPSLATGALLAGWGLIATYLTRRDIRRARDAWRDSMFGGWWKRLARRIRQAIASATPRPAFAGA